MTEPMIFQINITGGGTMEFDMDITSQNVSIDWGDGDTIEYTNTNPVNHVYIDPTDDGARTIKITGKFSSFKIMQGNDMLTEITQFGDCGIEYLTDAFRDCTNLTHVNSPQTDNLDNLTHVNAAWQGCTSLTDFECDLPNVITANYAWRSCNNLTDFSCNLSNLKHAMFAWQSCNSLVSFTTPLPSLTNATSAWLYCSELTVFSCNLSNLEYAGSAWYYCEKLTVFSCNLENVTQCSNSWNGCKSLLSFTTPLPSLKNAKLAWYNCESLIDFSCNLSALTNAELAWYKCIKLETFSSELSALTDASGAWDYTNLLTQKSQVTLNNYDNYDIANPAITWYEGLAPVTEAIVETEPPPPAQPPTEPEPEPEPEEEPDPAAAPPTTSATAVGDPYISTLCGKKFKLPNSTKIYRMAETSYNNKQFTVNASVSQLTDYEINILKNFTSKFTNRIPVTNGYFFDKFFISYGTKFAIFNRNIELVETNITQNDNEFSINFSTELKEFSCPLQLQGTSKRKDTIIKIANTITINLLNIFNPQIINGIELNYCGNIDNIKGIFNTFYHPKNYTIKQIDNVNPIKLKTNLSEYKKLISDKFEMIKS